MMSSAIISMLSRGLIGAGAVGAFIGGATEAARHVDAFKDGGAGRRKEAARRTGQEALGVGVATASGALVGGMIGGSVVLPIVAAFATAVGTKRAYDNWLDR
jgi:hypothetical protein